MKTPAVPYRRLAAGAVAFAIVAAAWLALREEPVPVDLAAMTVAPMRVTIGEEGIVRVRDVYALTAPIAGYLDRTTLEPGDPVRANETVVAAIHPLDPPFIDRRTEAELAAAVEAARSAVALAKVERERAAAGRDLARAEHARAARLALGEAISESALERLATEVRVAEATLASAEASIRLRRAELASAEARLGQPTLRSGRERPPGDCCIAIRSPVDGIVLTLAARSERAVAIGAPIAEIGVPSALEVEVEVLSADAVRIEPGTPVTLSDWGGDERLDGHVLRVEPAAFEKVSALGIEERRVSAIVALERAPSTLGHGYRVFAEMVVWHSDETLQVPLGALFRDGGDWAVFVAADGTAREREIVLGRMNATHAQVLDGLDRHEHVVLHPSDRVADGTAISPRLSNADSSG